MPANSPVELDRALRAVADSNRRAILAVIRGGPRSVGEIAEELGLSQQVTSHHLGVLRTARLADATRIGRQHLFSAQTDGLQVVQIFLNDFWPTKLSALKAAVEGRKAGRDG
jgi:DNA-binding transcriptional ArsR family regulator